MQSMKGFLYGFLGVPLVYRYLVMSFCPHDLIVYQLSFLCTSIGGTATQSKIAFQRWLDAIVVGMTTTKSQVYIKNVGAVP